MDNTKKIIYSLLVVSAIILVISEAAPTVSNANILSLEYKEFKFITFSDCVNYIGAKSKLTNKDFKQCGRKSKTETRLRRLQLYAYIGHKCTQTSWKTI